MKRPSGNVTRMSSKRDARPSGAPTVKNFLAALDHPHKAAIERIRSMVLGLDPRITESIKWNAPSFQLEDHFATFKLHPPTKIALVLHTGAKAKGPPMAFAVDDPAGLMTWPAPDRALVTLKSEADLLAHEGALRRILEQWIAQL
ncbi:MAG: DUF1801 domain-containing protein [Polyangiaceae bacterium]